MNGLIEIHLSLEPEEVERLLASHTVSQLEPDIITDEDKCMGVIIHLLTVLFNNPLFFSQVDSLAALALSPPGPIKEQWRKAVDGVNAQPRDHETGREQP